MRWYFWEGTAFNDFLVKTRCCGFTCYINPDDLDSCTLFTNRAEACPVDTRGPRFNAYNTLNCLTHSRGVVDCFVERRFVKIPIAMHLNMSNTVSGEHRDNVPVGTIGQTNG